MSYARKKVVFDTSALIPVCLHPNREPAHIFRQTITQHDVFSSPDAFNELLTVLSRDKFNAWQPLQQRLLWAKFFKESVVLIKPTEPVNACRDPKDNKFLELALAAKADFLVSSNIHLLEMHPFRQIAILSLPSFKENV